jgi:thymidylate kinase
MVGNGDPNKPFVTIQGMAGTGKTTIVKSILRKLEDDGKLPTGISVAALSRKAVHVLYDKIRDEFEVSAESVYTLAGAEPNVSEDRFAINPNKSRLP